MSMRSRSGGGSLDRVADAFTALVEPARATAKAVTHGVNYLERIADAADAAVETYRVQQIIDHGLTKVNAARQSIGLPTLPGHVQDDDLG